MDSLGSLNAFVRAAEARSFTVAGRQLGVSSSAIGKAVARMEERLRVRLLHRSTRSITLTAEGALFLEHCRRIFSEIEAAEIELSQTHEGPRGTSPPRPAVDRHLDDANSRRVHASLSRDNIGSRFQRSGRRCDRGGLRRGSALRRDRQLAFDVPGSGRISPTPRGGPGLSGSEGCPSDPGRPQGTRVPAPQVSDQRKVRAVAGAVRACRRRDRIAQDSCGKYN